MGGGQKFGFSLEPQGNQTFGRDIPGFCRDIPGRPKSLRKTSLCSILVPYWKVRKILGVFEVFVGVFKKTNEQKDRVLATGQSKGR